MARSPKKTAVFLVGILACAFFLRIIFLSAGDPLTDEVLYGFRAVGMLDFDEAHDQTTPLEWFDARGIPWWTRLSFHDHPPLVFFIQHISMKILGETNFGFRFPSVLFGVASVWLLYLTAKRLFGTKTALLAAFVLSVTANHVYISRTGLQESIVIFFVLLVCYFFLRALDDDTYLLWMGVALGLGALTKYTTFFLVPVLCVYLLLWRREYFLNKKLWFGVLIAIALFLPVIIYNIELYRAVGHFDFQFSALTGERPEVWKIQPGKEIGSLGERIEQFVPRLYRSGSWVFITLFFVSLFVFPRRRPDIFFTIVVLFLLAHILFIIGPSFRFLSMLTPFMALALAHALCLLLKRWRFFGTIFIAIFILFELLYTVNSQIIPYPRGLEVWAYSPVREEQYRWGYNELGNYIENELSGKRPAQVFDMRYAFLNKLHEQTIADGARAKLPLYSAVVIYDANIQKMAQLWLLDRLNIYHAWPVINTEQYIAYLRDVGGRDEFKNHYFIRATDAVQLLPKENQSPVAAQFEDGLVKRGAIPVLIHNKRNDTAFRIYKF